MNCQKEGPQNINNKCLFIHVLPLCSAHNKCCEKKIEKLLTVIILIVKLYQSILLGKMNCHKESPENLDNKCLYM